MEVVEIRALLPAESEHPDVRHPPWSLLLFVVKQVQPAIRGHVCTCLSRCRVRDFCTHRCYASPVTARTAATTVFPTATAPPRCPSRSVVAVHRQIHRHPCRGPMLIPQLQYINRWSLSLLCWSCWFHRCRSWRRQSRSHICRSSRKSLRSLRSRRSRALRHLRVSGSAPVRQVAPAELWRWPRPERFFLQGGQDRWSIFLSCSRVGSTVDGRGEDSGDPTVADRRGKSLRSLRSRRSTAPRPLRFWALHLSTRRHRRKL